MNRFFTQISLS